MSNDHAPQEVQPARENLCRLWANFQVAEEVGESLGGCEVLQRQVP